MVSVSRLLFDGHEYSYKALFELSLKSHFYENGEVVDLDDGESFDISEINNFKEKYFNEIINPSYRLNIINKENKMVEEKILEEKFKNNKINLSELELLIEIKSITKEPFSIKYKKFVTVNIGEELPELLTDNDVGKFYRMLFFLSKSDNILKENDRKNGRVIKEKELMKYLDFKTQEVYRRFIRRLVKSNIMKELKNSNNNKVIILNPVYVNKAIRIDYTTFLCFKEQLLNYLTEYEIKYLEMLGSSDDLISSYEICSF